MKEKTIEEVIEAIDGLTQNYINGQQQCIGGVQALQQLKQVLEQNDDEKEKNDQKEKAPEGAERPADSGE